MGRVQDESIEQTSAPTVERPGRVEVDSRGHNVWRWARDVLESTSVLLKRLENHDLVLEPTQKVPIMRGVRPAAKAQSPAPATAEAANASPRKPAARHPALQRERASRDGGGFDPDNSR